MKKDLIVGFQNIVLTKNEDYNRFIMFMTRATCGYNNNISIPCEKVANSILKVKEHYRTKKNRHNKLCEILKLFFLNEKKNICYLKLMDNNEFIVFYKENLPYKKENIREIYLCSDR